MTQEARDWKTDVDAIRRVLMSEWDPIGCGVPDDEYDAYIPVIYTLMQKRVSVEQLATHLLQIETTEIGLSARPAVNKKVAATLLRLMTWLPRSVTGE